MTGSSFLYKDRPIAKSLTEPFHDDPPYNIAMAMGGRQWFYDNATQLHRIGIFLGLGWRIPYGGARDGINYVRVVTQRGDKLDLQLLHLPDGCPANEAQPVRGVGGLDYKQLRQAYDEETRSA